MAYELARIKNIQGNVIQILPPFLPSEPLTNLAESVLATGVALTVLDNTGFAQNDFVILGHVGTEKTEAKRITAAVTAGTSLTVAALTFDHTVDTVVMKTLWDQAEISGAATLTGAKTVIATISLQYDADFSTYVNTGTTYAYYFVRYYNSNAATYSSYSDGVMDGGAVSGYAQNTVRAVKTEALAMTNEKIGDLITDEWLNNEIQACEQNVYREKKVWSWAYTFNSILGSTTTGEFRVALPTDISDAHSNKSILGVHIETKPDMYYITKSELDQKYIQIVHSTLAVALAAIDTSAVLTSSVDFADSGTINIKGTSYAYTVNTRSTNTLTLAAAAGTAQTIGSTAWQYESFGTPQCYTVNNGYLEFDKAPDSTAANKNVYLDYYRQPTTIDTDNDVLNIPDFTIYHHWLAHRILLRKNNGESTMGSDAQRAEFENRKKILMLRDRTGQNYKWRPRLNSIRQTDFDREQVFFSGEQP